MLRADATPFVPNNNNNNNNDNDNSTNTNPINEKQQANSLIDNQQTLDQSSRNNGKFHQQQQNRRRRGRRIRNKNRQNKRYPNNSNNKLLREENNDGECDNDHGRFGNGDGDGMMSFGRYDGNNNSNNGTTTCNDIPAHDEQHHKPQHHRLQKQNQQNQGRKKKTTKNQRKPAKLSNSQETMQKEVYHGSDDVSLLTFHNNNSNACRHTNTITKSRNAAKRSGRKKQQNSHSQKRRENVPAEKVEQQQHQQEKENESMIITSDDITMFPALSTPSQPQQSSFGKVTQQNNTIPTSTSSKWTNLNEKIFQSPEEDMEDNNIENFNLNDNHNDDFFEKLGLDRLTSSCSKQQQRRSNNVINNTTTDITTNNDDEENDGDQNIPHQQETSFSSSPSSRQQQQRQRPLPQQPKTINMDKLRDKWWAALALKKARKAMLSQLQERIQTDYFVSPVEIEINNFLKTTPLETKNKQSNNNCDDDDDGRITIISDSTTMNNYGSDVNTGNRHHTCTSNLQTQITPNDDDKQTSLSVVESFSESLDRAIRGNNDLVLKALISSWVEKLSREETEQKQHDDDEMNIINGDDGDDESGRISLLDLIDEAIIRIVDQDRPDLLMVTLSTADRLASSSKASIFSNNKSSSRCRKNDPGGRYKALFTKALLHSSQYGHEGCLSRLLSSSGPQQLISTRDWNENNVLHVCCLGSGSETTLRILLKGLSGKGKTSQQQLAKLLLSVNNLRQTPIHIACERGRVDLVETFLSICSSALLSKVLSMEDLKDQTPLLSAVAENATDTVVSLIMWRGNSCYTSGSRTAILDSSCNDSSMTSKQRTRRKKVPPCPLVWACKNGNLDLVYVLLQFSNPSGSNYSINEALCAMINSDANEETKVEAVRVLVGHGGNPFVEVLPYDGIGEEGPALRLAAKHGFNSVVRTLVETRKTEIRRRQDGRRRDPKLRQQPETFFRPMEIKENTEMDTALKLSLLDNLIDGWKGVQNSIDEKIRLHLSSAALLYSLGARMQDPDLDTLQMSMKSGKLQPENNPAGCNAKNVFVATYKHFCLESVNAKKVTIFDRAALNGWSKSLMQHTWMQKDIHNTIACNCPWVQGELDCIQSSDNTSNNEKIVLEMNDGSKLDGHRSILSRKSGKLASALRFAEMSQQGTSHDVSQEICIALSPRVCKRMLQHIYHGSIFSGWSRDKEENCHDVLELMLVGEEFLCPSLIQECAMRLVSSNPTLCFCWSCAKEVKVGDTFDESDCIYNVEGPPALLTSDTALDVLAVVQHLLSIDLSDRTSASETHDSKLDCTKRVKRVGIRALKDATVATILKEFAGVVKSYSFKASLELNDSSAPEVESQIMLLQMCLEEFQKVDSSTQASLVSLGTDSSSNQAKSLSRGIK